MYQQPSAVVDSRLVHHIVHIVILDQTHFPMFVTEREGLERGRHARDVCEGGWVGVLVEVYHEYRWCCMSTNCHSAWDVRLLFIRPVSQLFPEVAAREIAEGVLAGAANHVTRSWAELLGCSLEPFLARNGFSNPARQQPQSPSCQTAKMTFAWKAAGIT